MKNPPASAGDTRDAGSVPELGRFPLSGKRKPTQVFLPGKFHGQRSLADYRPWGFKELDTTEEVIPSLSTRQKFRGALG